MSAVLKSVSHVFLQHLQWKISTYKWKNIFLRRSISVDEEKNLSIVPHSKTKIVGERRDRNNRAWLMFLTFSFLGFLPAKRTSIFLLLWWFLSPRIGSWCFPLFSSSCIFPQWSKAPNESRSLSWAAKTSGTKMRPFISFYTVSLSSQRV